MTGPVCGWILDDGSPCPIGVERDEPRCGEHRRVEAAAKAAAARAAHARQRPGPVELPPLADEDAALIFSVLDRHQVAYVVIGGMAAAMWGSDLPRTTDADITPATRPVITLITDHGPLDVSFTPEGTTGYADLATRAVRLAVGDHPNVPVADLADVIASKEAAGRAKDLRQLPSLRRLLDRLRPP